MNSSALVIIDSDGNVISHKKHKIFDEMTNEEKFFNTDLQSCSVNEMNIDSILCSMLNDLKMEMDSELINIQEIRENFHRLPDIEKSISNAYKNRLENYFIFDIRTFLPKEYFLMSEMDDEGNDWENDEQLWRKMEKKFASVLSNEELEIIDEISFDIRDALLNCCEIQNFNRNGN